MAITPEMQALWDEVKANSKRLKECIGPHSFVGIESEVVAEYKDGKLYRRYVCSKCDGKVMSHDKRWYEDGLKHGKVCK